MTAEDALLQAMLRYRRENKRLIDVIELWFAMWGGR